MEVVLARKPSRGSVANLRILAHVDHDEPGDSVATAWDLLTSLECRSASGTLAACGQPLSLKVEDAQGRGVYCSHDPAALTQIPLTAGTYWLTARYGEVERRYPMALASRETIEVHLCLPAGQRLG